MKMRIRLGWVTLLAVGIACLWAGIEERISLTEAWGQTSGIDVFSRLQTLQRKTSLPETWTRATFVFTGNETPIHVANPFTAYANLAIPTDPQDRERVCTREDVIEGSCTTIFSMSGNDAILIGGRTISEARYFSFQLNQMDRWDGETGREMTTSSIGLGINHLTLKTYDQDPFDARFFMIVTASNTTSDKLKDFLASAGHPPGGINEYLFHRDFANGYLGEKADNLIFLNRISCVDETILDEYIASAPLKAFLIRGEPAAKGDVEQMAQWEPRPDSSELVLEEDQVKLITEIILHYLPEYGMPVVFLPELLHHANPEECRAGTGKCIWFDSPDAVYSRFAWSDSQISWPYLDDEDDFIIFAGVNHGIYNLETYFSYFPQRIFEVGGIRRLQPFGGFEGEEAIGSAQQYWPEAGDRFFAYKFALNCMGNPYCFEIPPRPGGVDPGERFNVNGRIYLDPVSKTGPDPGNFLPTYMMWYQGLP